MSALSCSEDKERHTYLNMASTVLFESAVGIARLWTMAPTASSFIYASFPSFAPSFPKVSPIWLFLDAIKRRIIDLIMPRIRFINAKPANKPPASKPSANDPLAELTLAVKFPSADSIPVMVPDHHEIGTGPEALAPWWFLLEQAIEQARAHPNPGPSVVQTQSIEPLTDFNLGLLYETTLANAPEGFLDLWGSSEVCISSLSEISHRAPNFLPQLYANGVLPPGCSKRPKNGKTLEKMIRYQPSGLQYPSEEEYKCWLRRTAAAPNPDTLIWEIYPLLDRFPTEKHYQTAVRKSFDKGWIKAPCSAGLRAPQPDLVQGIDMEGFGDVRVEHIPGAVLYEHWSFAITLAHVSGEFFGASSAEEKVAQTCSSHAGAALVYGRDSALKHVHRPDDEGHAHVLTFITNGTKITFFAHYASRSTNELGQETVVYHQFPLVSTSLRDSYASFKKGWAQLRNCQRYAFDRSHELRDLLEKQHRAAGATDWALQGRGGPRSPIKASQMLRPKALPALPSTTGGNGIITYYDDGEDGEDEGTVRRRRVQLRRQAKRKMEGGYRDGALAIRRGQDGGQEDRGKGEEHDDDAQKPAIKKRKKRC